MALNPRQREAVAYAGGPLLVLAGAGSGKTSVIAHKIAWLIRDRGLRPESIVAVTFTNKAAREMRSRVSALLGGAVKGLNISTFHTFGLSILKKECARLGYRKNFSIFDAEDSLALVQQLLRAANTDAELAERAAWRISHWKNALIAPEYVAALASDAASLAAARVYGEYQHHLKTYNAVDFDDLIVQPVRLFRADDDVRAAWRARLRHLLVDEYQDTNASQYELMRCLVGQDSAFTVVGDDDQSIYAWRGAQPENLQLLQRDFPNLKVVKLEQNYRSTGRILKAANTLIAGNPHIFEKKLWSDMGYGDPLRVLQTRSEEHEAERVVSQLLHHKFLHNAAWGDYAILYRGNHQARPFERVLREHRIPYYLSGGLSFFDRTEIKDVFAYLRLLANPDDDNAFLRVVNTPRREIGPASVEKLSAFARSRGSSLLAATLANELSGAVGPRSAAALRRFAVLLTDLGERGEQEAGKIVRELLREIDYETWIKETSSDAQAAERRLSGVQEVVAWVDKLQRDAAQGLADIVNAITLNSILDRDTNEPDGDQVALMTLHAAKGLEFPHVFLVGFEENLLPHRSSVETNAVEEERRLAYVAITRAKKTLTFSVARQRKRFGEVLDCEPSRFLGELPAEDLQWEGREEASPEDRRTQGEAHLANLRGILK